MLKKFTYTLVLLFATFLPLTTLAVGNLQSAKNNLTDPNNGTAAVAGYTEGDIGNMTGQVINTALSLIGIIFLALTVYAGFLWMTANGEESKIEKAQDIIKAAIIGLVITMSAYAITALVTKKFSSTPAPISAPAAEPAP